MIEPSHSQDQIYLDPLVVRFGYHRQFSTRLIDFEQYSPKAFEVAHSGSAETRTTLTLCVVDDIKIHLEEVNKNL